MYCTFIVCIVLIVITIFIVLIVTTIFIALINPRRACAARVTVVVLCVCIYVCVYVCVCPLIPAASHIGITKERYQTDSAQNRDRLKFCRFS